MATIGGGGRQSNSMALKRTNEVEEEEGGDKPAQMGNIQDDVDADFDGDGDGGSEEDGEEEEVRKDRDPPPGCVRLR